MRTLPPSAAAKLSAIEASAHDSEALMMAAQSRIKNLEDALQYATTLPDGDSAGVEHELSRQRAVRDSRRLRTDNDAQVAAQLRSWLQSLPPQVQLSEVKPLRVEPKDGEPLAMALITRRQAISDLSAQLQVLAGAPLPRDDLKQAARQYVERLASQGKPTLRTERGNFAIRWAHEGSNLIAGAAPLMATVAWLVPEVLQSKLDALIEALPDHPNALSADTKAAKQSKLSADLLRLEREEEALVEQAIAAGIDVSRRPLANPLAILSVEIAKPAPPAAQGRKEKGKEKAAA